MENHFGDSKDDFFSDKASEFTGSFTPEHRQHRAFKAAKPKLFKLKHCSFLVCLQKGKCSLSSNG